MSQEGNLPRQGEGSHGQAACPGGGSPACVGLVTARPVSSSSSYVMPPASENKSATVIKPVSSPAAAHAGENINFGSKPASPVAIHAGANSNVVGSKPASPAAVDADGSKAGEEEKDNNIAGEEVVGADVAAAGGGALSNSSKPAKQSSSSGSDGGVHGVIKSAAGAERDNSGKGKGKASASGTLHIWSERERRKKMKNMFSTLHSLLPRLPEKADKATVVGEAVDYIKILEDTVQKLEKLKQERLDKLQHQERMRAQALHQQLGVGSSSSYVAPAFSARHAAPPVSAPATREAVLADMVHSWNAQEAAATAAAAAPGIGTSSFTAPAPPRGGAVAAPAPAPAFQTWSAPNVVVTVERGDAMINLLTPRRPGMLTKALRVLEKHRIDVLTTTVSSDGAGRMVAIHTRINAAAAAGLGGHFGGENMTAEDRYKLAVSEIMQVLGI